MQQTLLESTLIDGDLGVPCPLISVHVQNIVVCGYLNVSHHTNSAKYKAAVAKVIARERNEHDHSHCSRRHILGGCCKKKKLWMLVAFLLALLHQIFGLLQIVQVVVHISCRLETLQLIHSACAMPLRDNQQSCYIFLFTCLSFRSACMAEPKPKLAKVPEGSQS